MGSSRRVSRMHRIRSMTTEDRARSRTNFPLLPTQFSIPIAMGTESGQGLGMSSQDEESRQGVRSRSRDEEPGQGVGTRSRDKESGKARGTSQSEGRSGRFSFQQHGHHSRAGIGLYVNNRRFYTAKYARLVHAFFPTWSARLH